MTSVSLAMAAQRAKEPLSMLSSKHKNDALRRMAARLISDTRLILSANKRDCDAASQRGISEAMLYRLTLSAEKVRKIADSLKGIADLPDPVGRVLWQRRRPNGLLINKVGVPIGVILIIYESRPNVTADCMGLCLKSANSVILKGGSEALHSNRAIFHTLTEAAVACGIPRGAFNLVTQTGHTAVRSLLEMTDLIDLVIPRGGENLIREVVRLSRIPVIKHYKGICHVYVDKGADLKKAASIAVNAKVHNPGVCNAMETLLVHEAVADKFLPQVCLQLQRENCQLRGCPRTRKIVYGLKKATESDWSAEYLDLILSIRVVKDLRQAIDHIQRYGSHHSDSIVTENRKAADYFTKAVDSACVFVNASTRFSDGGEFGMGAEMGISTDKLHARGPMGLEELTSYKYVVVGNGQVRASL